MISKFFLVSLLAILICPLLILYSKFGWSTDFSIETYLSAFLNSFLQASVTSIFCIGLSFILVPSLSHLDFVKVNRVLKLAQLPLLLPSLITFLIIFSYFDKFPFGNIGVILTFIIIFFGFSLGVLYYSYLERIKKFDSVMDIYNLSLFQKYRYVYFPLFKSDVLLVFEIIFLGCIASLSVPLLAGGGKSTNLEMYIFESVLINGQWGMVFNLAILQVFYLGVFQFFSKKQSRFRKNKLIQNSNEKSIKWYASLSYIILLGYVVGYIGGYLFHVAKALTIIQYTELQWNSFFRAVFNTLALSILMSVLVSLLITWIIYLEYKKESYKNIYNFINPSSTVIGLALFVIFSSSSSYLVEIFKISLGLTLIYGLTLIKSYLSDVIESLSEQFNIARIYNLSFFDVLLKIVFPQIKKQLVIVLYFIFMYCLFEFSFIKVVGVDRNYVGSFVEQLITSYRLEYGFFFSFIILFVFYFIFLFLEKKEDLNVSPN